MAMVNPDYQIDAIKILLNEDCILERFYPLIPYKEKLVDGLKKRGCRVKSDCASRPTEALLAAGIPNAELVYLFRRFLELYDGSGSKWRELNKIHCTPEEAAMLEQLYYLPGVKYNRAILYHKAGFSTLEVIACSTPEEILEKTTAVIHRENAHQTAPFTKEVRTHIAVAKAFTNRLGGEGALQ